MECLKQLFPEDGIKLMVTQEQLVMGLVVKIFLSADKW
jgi:hypothetical protein